MAFCADAGDWVGYFLRSAWYDDELCGSGRTAYDWPTGGFVDLRDATSPRIVSVPKIAPARGGRSEQEEACANDDAGVGDVEVGPVVVVDADGEEIDDVVEADAVVEIAESAAEDESERDRGEGEGSASAPEQDEDDDRGEDGEGDEAETDGVGRRFSSRLKAAPVLSTWLRWKNPGMTGMASRDGCGGRSLFLVRRSARMTSAVMRKRMGRRSRVVVAGLVISVCVGVGMVIKDILVLSSQS